MNTNDLTFCATCETYGSADPHICVEYTGPACKQCGQPTTDAVIGAPGYGRVRVCKNRHEEELSPCGILEPWDVI